MARYRGNLVKICIPKTLHILVWLFGLVCGIVLTWALLPSRGSSRAEVAPLANEEAAPSPSLSPIEAELLADMESARAAEARGDYEEAIQQYRTAVGHYLNEIASLLTREWLCHKKRGEIETALALTQQGIDLLDGWYQYSYSGHPLRVRDFVVMRADLLAAKDGRARNDVLEEWAGGTDVMGVVSEYVLAGHSDLPEAERYANLRSFVAKRKHGFWVGQALYRLGWQDLRKGDLAGARELFERALPEAGLGTRAMLESLLRESDGLEKLRGHSRAQELRRSDR